MTRDPVLAARTIRADHGNLNLTLRVEGGLHYIKGNGTPYFSLTCTSHRKGFPNQMESCGVDHDMILKYYPHFADLAALHLSDIDGVPMYAAANGWYLLAGYFGGDGRYQGEQYHVGNSKRQFPVTPPADKPWQNTEYREPTAEEALQLWANHLRVDLPTARALADRINVKWNWPDMKAEHAKVIEEQRPRWKAEAEAAIKKHNLAIYGDQWPAGLFSDPGVAA